MVNVFIVVTSVQHYRIALMNKIKQESCNLKAVLNIVNFFVYDTGSDNFIKH